MFKHFSHLHCHCCENRVDIRRLRPHLLHVSEEHKKRISTYTVVTWCVCVCVHACLCFSVIVYKRIYSRAPNDWQKQAGEQRWSHSVCNYATSRCQTYCVSFSFSAVRNSAASSSLRRSTSAQASRCASSAARKSSTPCAHGCKFGTHTCEQKWMCICMRVRVCGRAVCGRAVCVCVCVCVCVHLLLRVMHTQVFSCAHVNVCEFKRVCAINQDSARQSTRSPAWRERPPTSH